MLLSASAAAWAQTRGNADYNVEYSAAAKGDMRLRFSVKGYKLVDVVKNGVAYTTIEFNHGVTTEQKGFAELPMLGTTLQLAASGDVELVIEEGEYQDIELKHPLLPSRGVIYRNQNPDEIPYKVAPESLVDEWYPARVAYTESPFVYRDTRGVNVYAYPFRYNAARNILRVYKSMILKVKRDGSSTTNPLTIAPKSVDPTMRDSYKSLYINYAEDKFAHQLGEWGEMLVLYTQRDADAIAPYIEWKRQKGFTVHTQQVATGTNVVNTIRTAYNNNPNLLYVQLVGDWADIKSNLGTTENAPMDPYMGCVAGNDYYPELIIGRFSGNNAAQITVQVNKAINYERNPDMNGAWYSRGLQIASSEGPGDDSEYDYEHLNVIKDNKLLPYTYTAVNTQYEPTATANGISQNINAGLGVINYTGHGYDTYWVTTRFTNDHVNALNNGNQLPFIFSVACVVGKYHRTNGDCFAEAWLKKENGGAVAVIMSTINQPWTPPMRGQDYFNDILVGGYNYDNYPRQSGTSTTADDQRTTFGSITFNGTVLMLAEQYNSTDTRETFQTWTVFGDASLQVRTAQPKAISVAAGNVNGSPYTVTVTSNGTAVANARVALFQNGQTYTAVTNAQGVATVNHQLANGTAKLTVTGYNCGTYQTDVNVGGSTGTAPAIPTGLTASNITTTTASISWNAVDGATGYKVLFNGTEYSVNGTSANITGLTANTSYTWSVKAENAHGSSNYSATNTFTTLSEAAPEPQPEPEPVALALPYAESFDANTLPEGWMAQTSSTSLQSNWVLTSTNKAGGAANEMRCKYQNANGIVRLVSPAINTRGTNRVTLSFKHFFDAYRDNGVTLRVQTSNDLQNWTNTDWSVATTASNIGPENVSVEINSNMNSATTYFAFVIEGNHYYFDYWHIDDVALEAEGAPAMTLPTVATYAVTNITTTTATFNAEVTANGNAAVTARGFCIGYTPNPTLNDAVVTVGSGTGAYQQNVTGLTPNTTYYLCAYATNQMGTAYGEQVSFSTQPDANNEPEPMPTNYCASMGANANYEWINVVRYAGIDNTSGTNGGYADFTAVDAATVALGETNTLYLQAGFSGSAYTKYWRVWIDYNRDGVFADNELIANGASSSGDLMSVDIATPADASVGITRMRVSMKFGGYATACESFNYGEVEDYAVNIVSQRGTRAHTEPFAAQQLEERIEPMFTLYPNPVVDVLNIKAEGLQGSVKADIFNAQGTLVRTEYISASQPINVADLAAGLYFVTIHEERMPVTLKFIKR